METTVQLPATTVAATTDDRPAVRHVRPVRSYQALAVVCAMLCFRPLGVAAVVSAGTVRTRLALGDHEGARRASRRALGLCCASASVTLFFLLVIVLGSVGYSDTH
jgi:hypothetical protein